MKRLLSTTALFATLSLATFAQMTGNGYCKTDVETHFLKVNAEAVAIYNQLYELFPMDYVVNERPHKVDYVIRARFRSKAEWEEKRAKLEDI